MSIDYSETVVMAAEEIALVLKELRDELRELRKTHNYVLTALEQLVRVQTNRP